MSSLFSFYPFSLFVPSIGTLFGVLLLVTMAFLFEAKRPAEEDEMRFKGIIYSGITSGISFLAISYAQVNQLMSAENTALLFVNMVQILIGIVQPYLYITSRDNLRAYAMNLLVKTKLCNK